jgi:hypothetical protein
VGNKKTLPTLPTYEHKKNGKEKTLMASTRGKANLTNTDNTNLVKSDNESELISLNLIFTYPVEWTRYKVMRDFIQNFFDAVGPDKWKDRFSYRREGNALLLVGHDVSFSYDWLIHIGASTKRNSDEEYYAGFFGEGFKIASLCALRDYQWHIEMKSKDWELEVMTTDINVDQEVLKSLAYRVWRKHTEEHDSVLTISPISDEEMEIFECAMLSFFYKGNPLLGKEIWSAGPISIYYRSDTPKPYDYPSTYQYSGNGIIFAGFQALGSHSYDLVFGIHNHRTGDRERNNFFKMHVIEIIHSISRKLPPEAAYKVLVVLKDKWYDYPQKRYDFETWYSIVKQLASIIGCSPKHKEKWRKKYPNLLVAKKLNKKDIPGRNKRRQAKSWLENQLVKYHLVQDGFLALDYPELEELCEKNGGFTLTRVPTELEKRYIKILEQTVEVLYSSFIYNKEIPPCYIIKSKKSVWQGMANCIKLNKPVKTDSGYQIRYRLPYVAMKHYLFKKGNFGRALSTYLHELSHSFGSHKSKHFIRALSDILEIALVNVSLLTKIEVLWDKVEDDEE